MTALVLASDLGPWETSCGIDPGGEPEGLLSRPLRNVDGRYDWPDAELTGGIALVEIHAYGDQPGSAYVRVGGRGRAAVEATHARTVALVRDRTLVPLFEAGA